MSKTTNLNVRIDKDLKEQAEHLFNDLGLNMTTALSIFLRQSVRQGNIPFEITTKTDPFYSETNMRVIKKALDDMNNGKGTQHELIEN